MMFTCDYMVFICQPPIKKKIKPNKQKCLFFFFCIFRHTHSWQMYPGRLNYQIMEYANHEHTVETRKRTLFCHKHSISTTTIDKRLNMSMQFYTQYCVACGMLRDLPLCQKFH